MSDHAIMVATLWLSGIAALTGVITVVPQLPAIWRMVIRPHAEVIFHTTADDQLAVVIQNGRWVGLDNIIAIVEFEGATTVRPKIRFTPANSQGQGFISASPFHSLNPTSLQATVPDSLSPKASIGLGELDVEWEQDGIRRASWSIYVDHKIIDKGVQTF